MRDERPSVDRRDFLRHGIAIGAGALVLRRGPEHLLGMSRGRATVPLSSLAARTTPAGRRWSRRGRSSLAVG